MIEAGDAKPAPTERDWVKDPLFNVRVVGR